MSKKTDSPIILVGMHRSGTTLLSNQLKELGLFTGKSLGIHGEADFYVKLNDWLLSQTASTWDNPEGVAIAYEDDNKVEFNAFVAYLKIILKSPLKYKFWGSSALFSKKKLWGFKDPVSSLTLPFWMQIYPNAKVIFIKRHGIDVSNSLVVRNRKKFEKAQKRLETKSLYKPYLVWSQFFKKNNRNRGFIDSLQCKDLAHGVHLWDHYNDKCYEYMRAIPEPQKHEIKYEDFLQQPEKVLSSVAAFLELENTKEKIQELSKEINPKRAYSYKGRFTKEEIQAFEQVLQKHGYEL